MMLYTKVYKIYWELCLGQGFGFNRGCVDGFFETEEQAKKYIKKCRENKYDWKDYTIEEVFIPVIR